MTGAGRGAGNGTGQNGNVLPNSAPFNSANSSRNLSIGTFNGDVKLGLGKLKLKVYGQAAYNFQGGQRDSQEYGQPVLNDDTTDKLAFATGLTIGSDYKIKKKGDFVLLAEYRQVGLGSVDPNLNDSDWNFSRLGFRGIKAAAQLRVLSLADRHRDRLRQQQPRQREESEHRRGRLQRQPDHPVRPDHEVLSGQLPAFLQVTPAPFPDGAGVLLSPGATRRAGGKRRHAVPHSKRCACGPVYSTVTLLARLRGLSTSRPRCTAVWYASNCSGMTVSSGER